MSTRFTLLGTGSSGGVPRVGPVWGACDPANPKNRRRRCALLVDRFGKGGRTTVLVDTPADLREQLLDARVETLDGVLYTHDHADHTHGIDDLRGVFFNMRRRVRVWAEPATRKALESRFEYCFSQKAGSLYPSILQAHDINPPEPVRIEGAGGADRGRADRAGPWRRAVAGVPLRQRRLLARHQRHSGQFDPAAAGARPVDRRCLAPDAAPEPLLGEAGAGVDRAFAASSAQS